jgi:type IV secretion system protein VirD4
MAMLRGPKPTEVPGELLLGWDVPRQKPASVSAGRATALWHGGEGHLLTIAPTGAGKGVSCIIPALLTWDGPAIVVDPKGENYAVTAEHRRKLGHKVALLDPFGVTDAGRRDSLNPLDLIPADSPSAADDAAVIARLVVQGRVTPRDPFWDERAESLIAGLVLYVAQQMPSVLRHLGEVRTLVEQPDSQLEIIARDMRATGSTDVAAAANILETRASNTRSGIMSTTSSHLSFLRGEPVLQALSQSSIKLDDVLRGKPLTIYLVVPPDKLISHGKLLRLWLGTLMTVLARRRRLPEQPTLLIVDEAAQLGPLDELRAAVTLMRGYGVKVWSFWQDLSQLKRTYPLDWQSIVNNSAVQQFFGASSPQAVAELESYLAQGRGPSLSSIGEEDVLLIERGRAPRTARRANYLSDRVFHGLAGPNPFYQDRKAAPPRRRKSTKPDNVIAFPTDRAR